MLRIMLAYLTQAYLWGYCRERISIENEVRLPDEYPLRFLFLAGLPLPTISASTMFHLKFQC